MTANDNIELEALNFPQNDSQQSIGTLDPFLNRQKTDEAIHMIDKQREQMKSRIDSDNKEFDDVQPNIHSGSTSRILRLEANLATYFRSQSFDSIAQIPNLEDIIDSPNNNEKYQKTLSPTENDIKESEDKTDCQMKLQSGCMCCCSTIFVILIRVLIPIVALLYAKLYDEDSDCNDGTNYFVDPNVFLKVVAIIDIIMFVLYFFNLFGTSCGENDPPEKWKYVYGFLKFLNFIFMIAASSAGFYIFYQMSEECRAENIAIILLIYCIKIVLFNLCCTISFYAYKALHKSTF